MSESLMPRPGRVTQDELEELAWNAGAPIEMFMDVGHVVVGGREFSADLPAVTA